MQRCKHSSSLQWIRNGGKKGEIHKWTGLMNGCIDGGKKEENEQIWGVQGDWERRKEGWGGRRKEKVFSPFLFFFPFDQSDDHKLLIVGEQQTWTVVRPSSYRVSVGLQMEEVWQVHLLLQAGLLLLVPVVLDWLHCLLDWAWPSLCQWNCGQQRNRGRELCSLHLLDKRRAYCDTGACIGTYSFRGRILVTDCSKQYL